MISARIAAVLTGPMWLFGIAKAVLLALDWTSFN
jgi:hypothetical protein